MRIRMVLGGMLTACALGLVLPVLAVAQINIGINIGALITASATYGHSE